MGAAVRAADGLGVVAAVFGVVVFFGAAGAHGEVFHGGAAAVVGGGFLDGEAGAAVGAVDEGVEVAGVLWVVEFAGAVVAGGDVGGDVDGALLVFAFDDLEVVELGGASGEFFGAEGEDDGAGGGILLDGAEEIFAGGGGALGVDFDVGAFVGDGAVEAVAAGEVGDEGAEADALDDAGDGGADEGHGGMVLSWGAMGCSWSGRAGALRRLAQRRIFPREFAGAHGEAMGLFSWGRGWFFRRRSDVHRFARCRKAPALPKLGLPPGRAPKRGAEAVAALPVRRGEQDAPCGAAEAVAALPVRLGEHGAPRQGRRGVSRGSR